MPDYPVISPNKLAANPWNTNRCSPEAEAKLDESLRRLGAFKPVIVRQLADGTLEILGGQHRVESAIRLGLKEIPYHNLGAISDKRAKEISLVDNGRYGEDDTLQLAKLLEDLGSPEEIASFMPFSSTDLDHIFAATDIDLDGLELDDSDETAPPPPPPKPQTHVVMRFKVPIGDSSRLTELIEKTMKQQGFTEEDQLSNAGNALVHLLTNRDE